MIHAPKVETTCDRYGCIYTAFTKLCFKRTDPCGGDGYYDTSPGPIEEKLRGKGWIVREGKHYCCEECAESISQGD